MAASQGTAAARAVEESVRPQPQRFRVNVPAADEAVLEWMAAQHNHSLSVRILIRESIERHGYVDAMNRPVEQLPKRGRPAVAEDESAAAREPSTGGAKVPGPVLPAQVPPVAPAASAPAPLDLDSEDGHTARPELLGIALQTPSLMPVGARPDPVPAPVPAAAMPTPDGPEPASSGQVDVNDIFSSIR